MALARSQALPDPGLRKKVNSDIFRMVLPVITENILQMSAGLITSAMIGRLMADDISAQGISLRVYNTFWSLFKGIGIGATVVAALRYGQRRFGDCRRTIEQTYLTLVPFALLFMAIIFAAPGPIVGFLSDEPALYGSAISYLRIAVWALPFAAITVCNTAAFNGHGNTKTPMYIALLLNAVNIVVGFVLIFGIGSYQGMGLMGAAIATVVSQATGAVTGLLLLYRRGGYFADEIHDKPFFSLDMDCIREIYRTGIPAACENVFWQLAAMLLSKIILLYGSTHFAAYQLGLQAEQICEMPGIGFTTAATTLSARAIGQRDDKLFRAYYSQMHRFSIYTGVFTSLMLFLFPSLFMQLLTDKPDIQQLGTVYVFIMGLTPVPQDLNKVYNGFMRSAGYRRTPMAVSFVGIWVVRVPLAFLFGWILHLDIAFIWIAIALDQITRLVLSMLIFYRKKVINTVSALPQAQE